MTKVSSTISQKGVAGSISQKGVTGSISQKSVAGSVVESGVTKPTCDNTNYTVDSTVITVDNG